jgi:hypothetical protein
MIALSEASVLGGVSGIGTAADGAAIKVGLLQTKLGMLGALTIAPIVIPIEYDFAKSKYNPLGGPLRKLGATLAGPSSGPSGGTDAGIRSATQDAKALLQQYPGTDVGHAGPAERQAAGALMARYPGITPDQWASIWRIAPGVDNPMTGGAAKHAALAHRAAQHAAAAASGTSATTRAARTPYTPSRVAGLDLALARNPNSRAAINAKLAYDREAASFAEARIAAGRGSAGLVQQLQSVYQDETSLGSQLKSLDKKAAKKKPKAKAGFAVPLALQLAVAKAGTTSSSADDSAAATAIKAYDEKLLSSHKESLQSQIAIYDSIAQQNGVIGKQVLGKATVASAHALTAGITSAAQRRLVEQRVAQALAHGGHIPAGVGAGGGGTVVIHVHGDTNPDRTADRVLKKLQQAGRHGTVQRRGAHAGSYMGLH